MAAVSGVIIILVFFYIIMLGLLVASYIMSAIGFQTIARRRGIKCPWLAWIPFANYWILGGISDEYDCRNGKKSSKRKSLLALSIIAEVLLAIFLVLFVVIMGQVVATEYMTETYVSTTSLIGALVPFLLVAIATEGVLIALLVIMCIALYKVYRSTVPEKAVAYLLLSIFIPLAQGICLMKCRNEGYPQEEGVVEDAQEDVQESVPEALEQEAEQQD